MKDKTIVNEVEISSPDKLIYKKEKITKLDVVQYYNKVSKKMFPYLEKRLISVIRCHEGIGASCFFKKHPSVDSENISKITLKGDSENNEYYFLKNERAIVEEAQFGTIEFHTWGCRADKIDKPDIMIFDLDPDEGLSLESVRQGVIHLKSILDKLNLISFLKTSGGKGYHVIVPFTSTPDYEKFNSFAKQIAEVMETKWPALYTTNIRKVNRKGKIFVDYMRNTKGATCVAPYSLRSKKDSSVSMPIAWSKLNKIEPNQTKLKDALKLIKLADPWKNFFNVKQEINL